MDFTAVMILDVNYLNYTSHRVSPLLLQMVKNGLSEIGSHAKAETLQRAKEVPPTPELLTKSTKE